MGLSCKVRLNSTIYKHFRFQRKTWIVLFGSYFSHTRSRINEWININDLPLE